jgi:AcrR family transcriptional regulator
MTATGQASRADAGATARESRAPYRKLNPGPGMSAVEVAAHQTARLHSATIEIVAKRGYEGAKVRDISRLAGVSTRAFYEHFESKQDCVLQTYELVARRATRRIISQQSGEDSWQERARLVLGAFAQELKGSPKAGRFALVEACAAGPAALEQVRRHELTFEAMLGEGLARAPGGVVVPPLVIEGMVAGVAHVARMRLVAGRAAQLPKLEQDLVDWALCYPGEPAGALVELDIRSASKKGTGGSLEVSAASGNGGGWRASGDRALILAAIAKLTASEGYGNLTVPRVRGAAGVSRRTFDSHFRGVEDCFIAALEQRAAEMLSRAALAQVASRTWSGGVYRTIASLCDDIAEDHFLASVCLSDDFQWSPRIAQCRSRLIAAVAEQLSDSVPMKERPSQLSVEATSGAVWGLFQNHIVKDWAQRPQLSATLSYMALAPTIGASAAVAAIRREQKA